MSEEETKTPSLGVGDSPSDMSSLCGARLAGEQRRKVKGKYFVVWKIACFHRDGSGYEEF